MGGNLKGAERTIVEYKAHFCNQVSWVQKRGIVPQKALSHSSVLHHIFPSKRRENVMSDGKM